MDEDLGISSCLNNIQAWPGVSRENKLPSIMGNKIEAISICTMIHCIALQGWDVHSCQRIFDGFLVVILHNARPFEKLLLISSRLKKFCFAQESSNAEA